MSRRTFLKFTGLAATGVALSAHGIPVSPFIGEASAAGPEAEPAGRGWNDLPLVEGEPKIEGKRLIDPILVLTKTMNGRAEPSTTSTATKMDAGTVGRVLQVTDVLDEHTWAQTKVDFDGKEPIKERVEFYFATDVGSTKIYSTPEEVLAAEDIPDALKTNYVVDMQLAISLTEYTPEQMTGLFANIGGEAETDIRMAAAWGQTVAEGELAFGESPVDSWKRLVTTAAMMEPSDGTVDGEVNVCTIIDSNTMDSCNFYRKEDEKGITVIGRMLNREDTEHPNIFTITQFNKGENEALTVAGIGITTNEGLVEAYGIDSANKIASSATAIANAGTIELAEEIAKLEHTKVFLAAAAPGGVMTDRLKVDQKITKALQQKGISVMGNPQYIRANSGYQAILYGTKSGSTQQEIVYQADYVDGEWINIPPLSEFLATTDGKKVVGQYASTMGLNAADVMARLEQSQGNFLIQDQNGSSVEVLLDPETGVPLIVKEKDGWHAASMGTIADIKGTKVRLGGNVHMIRQYADSLARMNGYSMPDGHWMDPNYRSPLRPNADTFDFSAYDPEMGILESQGINDVQFFHLLWGLQYALPDWLINGNYSSDQFKDIAINHITSVVDHYKGKVDKYVVVNEAWGNPWDDKTRFWQDKLGDPAQWVPDMFRAAHEADPEAALVFNDFGVEVPGTRWWNEQKEPAFFNIANQMRQEGLPIEAGFQLHLYAADFADPGQFDVLINNYRRQLAKYRDAGIPVNITEFDLFPDDVDAASLPVLNAKITEAIVQASFEEGVKDFTFFGTPGSEQKQPLFDQSKNPTQAYYAGTKALVNS